MNLRLSEGSVRIRLSREDLEKALCDGTVSSITVLPGASLGVRVLATQEARVDAPLKLEVQRGLIRIEVPRIRLLELSQRPLGKDVGVYEELELPSGQKLSLALEVDLFSPRKGARATKPAHPPGD